MAIVASVVDETTLNPSAPLQRPHNRYDAVTTVLGDRLCIRRVLNVDGKGPPLEALSPHASRSLQVDKSDTFYTDSTLGAGYWYLLKYWGELTDEETPLDLSTAVRGDHYARYATQSAIRSEAGFDNASNLHDAEVDQQRRAAQAEINTTGELLRLSVQAGTGRRERHDREAGCSVTSRQRTERRDRRARLP